jgi:2'-5' RNA ligase
MRLFVAIELDRSMKRSLSSMIDDLSRWRRDVKWVREEQMHLTLKFLGETPNDKVSAVRDAAKSVADATPPFTLSLDACGCFPPSGKVRVIWGGCVEPAAELLRCAARCEDAFAGLGFARERRAFSPHLTVGRVRDDRSGSGLRGAIDALTVKKATQDAESLSVFESTLSPSGAQYTPLGHFPFKGAA